MENTGMDFYCRNMIVSRLFDSGRDTRYSLKAYEFVFLIFSILEKTDRTKSDFSAREVVKTAVKTANFLYGLIAEFVLADMGIISARDIGAVISNLTDLGVFSKSGFDRSEDFDILSKKSLFSRVKPIPLRMENLKVFEDT